MLVALTPLTETLVVFHELMKLPRLAACQQKVPAPSNVNGIVMVDVTGLQAPPAVGVAVVVGPVVGVLVRVGVLVIASGVNVRVGVLVMPGVFVRVGVFVIAGGVNVRVGVLVITGELVRVGVLVTGPGVLVTDDEAKGEI